MNTKFLTKCTFLLTFAAVPLAFAEGQAEWNPLPAERITVLGESTVTAQPDTATVQIGVETFGPVVTEATARNRDTMQAVYETLLSLGVEEKDMQTANYNIHFERRYPEPEQETDGIPGTYRVSNMLSVTLRDLSSVGEIIEASIGAGANQLWGVQFGLSNPEEYASEARVEAIENAREKASELAGAAGLTLGHVIRITETGADPGMPGPRPMLRELSSAAPVAPGEITFRVALEVVFSASNPDRPAVSPVP